MDLLTFQHFLRSLPKQTTPSHSLVTVSASGETQLKKRDGEIRHVDNSAYFSWLVFQIQ